jgi:hypothetical protein
MPSTESLRRAQKKYNDKHKLENNERDRNYYENHHERLKLKRRLRYYKQKLARAEYMADLSQSASERLPYLLEAHLITLKIMSLESAT